MIVLFIQIFFECFLSPSYSNLEIAFEISKTLIEKNHRFLLTMGCNHSTAKVVGDSPKKPKDEDNDSDMFLPFDDNSNYSEESHYMNETNRDEQFCILSFSDYVQLIGHPIILEYQFLESIGRGSHGEVYLCRNIETDDFYAAKVYSKLVTPNVGMAGKTSFYDRIITEINILCQIKDKHCIQLIDVLDDDSTQSIIIIMTLAKDGSLLPEDALTTPFAEKQAQNYFVQIALGIQHLHSLNVVHRDIKPHNILKRNENDVVISDYSASAILQTEETLFTDTEGTPMFYSPEECSGEPYLPKPADIWALGVSLYIMIYGRPPFFEEDDAGIFLSHFYRISKLIQENEVVFDESIPASESLIDLLKHLLDKDPTTRYTINDTLNHPWVKEGIENLHEEVPS
ncbi:CAMK family protein kinase [Tritrichomonas foetus]|uniref:CAMK family protein kinase n=1 Tax=Tritrichomonas foetus TaxID=1144522 RepID=A0A1J4K6A7_9EUKA|nr:CAMK family protein kinase [Tritrichomonas foetus]|eukprot:OHT06951.1 CAMK family protein kinase [Tritrichomonas foetus]